MRACNFWCFPFQLGFKFRVHHSVLWLHAFTCLDLDCRITGNLLCDYSFCIRFSRGAERLSVSEYFDRTYKRLLYPYLPCVQVGSSKRPIYLPMEVLLFVYEISSYYIHG